MPTNSPASSTAGGGTLPAPQPPRLKVFLSHATEDKSQVELVRHQIEALCVDVYLAEHDPQPGASIAAKIEAAIEASDVLVVLITTHGLNSSYVHQEIGVARALQKPIIPIVDVHADKDHLGMLREVEWLEVDFAQPAEALEKLTTSVQPFVMRQFQTMSVSVPNTAPQMDWVSGLMILGLGVLLAYLVFSIAQTGTTA
jgi:nucleoside 2-deoxyribosyltransferase